MERNNEHFQFEQMQFEKVIEILIVVVKCLGYVYNPRSQKEGTETSRRRTDDLGSRLARPIHIECKLKEPMHIGMRLLHPAAADHSVSIIRQQVHRIFRFSLRSRAGIRSFSGGTAVVATGRDWGGPRCFYPFEVRTQEETGSTRRLENLANVLGVTQPAAQQISVIEAPWASD